jgi:iron(III) transport system permease protein
MDPGLEEASRSLGRPRSATFVLVTLPLLRPAIVAGGLLVALYTLSDFGAVSLLRYQTFTWSIFIQYDSAFDRTLAAGLSLVLVGIALTLLFVESFTRGRGTYHRVTPGTARRASLVRLGAWRYPAAGFVWTVVSIALFAPLAVLMYWVVRGVSAGEPLDILWTAGRNSLYVSGLAAGAAAVAAVPVAVLSVRFPGLLSAAIERLTFVGFALPGMAVALAFVFFASAYAAPLYQTLLLLVLAYMVLFLPAAVGATQASLRQVSPRLEEVARGLGRTPMLAFVSVTLPLLYRGVAAGAALVFLLAMKELPATLILSPIGFKTLATAIWSASEEAFFARAAAPALLLVLVASVPLALMEVRRSRGASAMQK